MAKYSHAFHVDSSCKTRVSFLYLPKTWKSPNPMSFLKTMDFFGSQASDKLASDYPLPYQEPEDNRFLFGQVLITPCLRPLSSKTRRVVTNSYFLLAIAASTPFVRLFQFLAKEVLLTLSAGKDEPRASLSGSPW